MAYFSGKKGYKFVTVGISWRIVIYILNPAKLFFSFDFLDYYYLCLLLLSPKGSLGAKIKLSPCDL